MPVFVANSYQKKPDSNLYLFEINIPILDTVSTTERETFIFFSVPRVSITKYQEFSPEKLQEALHKGGKVSGFGWDYVDQFLSENYDADWEPLPFLEKK